MGMATPYQPSSFPGQGKVGYEVLRECHKRAYAYLSEALRIDENGVGDKNAAIDYYSKGVTELEKGISYDVHANGEELEKAKSIKKKMISNLEMARDRVTVLLDGGELRGSSSPIDPKKKPLPTESLYVLVKKNPQTTRKNAPLSYAKGKGSITGGSRIRKMNEGVGKPTRLEAEKKGVPGINVKGVEPNLVQSIMDNLLEQTVTVTWEDIVGLELPKRTLQEIVILPTIRPELFTGLRSPARGLLLFGPPGNGKTMLAKAVAHESHAKFFNVSASSLTSKWVGEGEKLVKALFAIARELQPSVIFLDEVDALLSERGGKSEHDSMRRLKNEFLMAFDGMSSTEGERILVMAATNRPHELDDAALRRFEKRIYIPLPSFEARKSVLHKLLSKHKNTITPSQLDGIASLCEGYSGSDLTALAKDAALGPIRDVDYDTLCRIPANEVRPMNAEDFDRSMRSIRPSVSPGLTEVLEKWNASFGVSA